MGDKSGDTPPAAPVTLPTGFTATAIQNKKIEECVKSFSNASNLVEQQIVLKAFAENVESDDDAKFVANIISHIFLSTEMKHPLKKTVTRILLTMPEDVVIAAVVNQIIALITVCEDSAKEEKLKKENSVLNNLACCFSNFPPGVEALSSIVNLVFIFACNNFLKSATFLYLEDEIDKALLHTYIYNSSKFLVSVLNQCDISTHMAELSFKLLITCYKIITDESIAFNTKSNCGILLVMAAIHGPEKNDEAVCGLTTLLRLEGESGENLLSNTLLLSKNYTAKICIFSGILNTIPHEIICADKLGDVPAPIYIFQSLLESATKRTGKSCEITEISRTFMTLSRLLFNMELVDIHVIFASALDYIWTHLDHFVAAVRKETVSVLRNFVEIAVKHKNLGDDSLMNQVLNYIVGLFQNIHTNYKALMVISNETTCSYLLEKFPELPRRLLHNMKIETISQRVCMTYEYLMQQHGKEKPALWVDTWVKHVVDLIHTSKGSIYPQLERIFTTAFKNNHEVIKLLSHGNRAFDNPCELSVMLSCFICARKLNVKVTFYTDEKMRLLWNNMIECDLLEILMCHQTPGIRISVLTLIVESHKTTELFTEWDFRFLVRYLKYNIVTQQPHVRQSIMAMFKKALRRYKDSLYVITRNIKNMEAKLKIIGTSNKQLVSKLAILKRYEDYYNRFVQELFEMELVRGLLADVNYPRRCMCLELLSHLKDAVSPEKYNKLWRRDFVILLYHSLEDSYESNIMLATKLLLELPPEVCYYQSKEQLMSQMKNCIAMAATIKPADTITAAYSLQVYKNSPHAWDVLVELQGIENPDRDKISVTALLFSYIIGDIEKGLSVAKDSVLMATKYAPIYGLIFCLRHLIEKEHFEEEKPQIVPKLLELCSRVSSIASPIVNTSSPEGFMPTSDDGNETDDTVTSQMVLVYAWRTVKEISLLLGELNLISKDGKQLITAKYLGIIADYFITLFMETKHRGAYEQAYLGFSKFCSKLWNCGNTVYVEWPINWLNTILDVLAGKKSDFSKLCSTRRSAGVPFVIQAILTTEPTTRSYESFHKCMKTLLEIARNRSEANEKSAMHSMNILRALYKHNQLGEQVTEYVGEGVKIAIEGFSHPVWGVRNSATLMFASLIMRLFGVQRTKDSEELSMKNKLAARVFFMRYPELYDFILEKLREYTVNHNESIYPLLVILGRLYPSSEESEMLKYLPFIYICLSSSNFKMRELAAHASIAAIPMNCYKTYVGKSLESLATRMPENKLHGTLFQLTLLIKRLHTGRTDLDIPLLLKDSFWIITEAGDKVSHVSATVYIEVISSFMTKFRDKCVSRPEFDLLLQVLLEKMEDKSPQRPVTPSKTEFELASLALFLQIFAYIIDQPVFCREKFIKDIIMAALYSSSEPRQIFALNCIRYLFKNEFYSHSMNEDEDEEVCSLEHALITPLKDDTRALVISALTGDLGCNNILTDFIEIMLKRKQEFKMRVCQILPYFPCIVNRVRTRRVPAWLEKGCIMDFLGCQLELAQDSETFGALLLMVNTLLFHSKNPTLIRRSSPAFIRCILRSHSSPERDTGMRLAVADFLMENAKFLYDQQNMCIKEIVETWYIVLDLLQDNDLIVRDRMSKISNYIPYPDSPIARRPVLGIYVVAEKSLEELLFFMPHLIPFDEAMRIYLSLAVRPKGSTISRDCEEIFNKGELNPYAEGDPISLLATKYLRKYLWSLDGELHYADRSIFLEEHTLLVASRLFNVFYTYHIFHVSSETKLLGMLVLKEVMNYIEARPINAPNFKADFIAVLEKKFASIFAQSPTMFKRCRVEAFLKFFFSFDS